MDQMISQVNIPNIQRTDTILKLFQTIQNKGRPPKLILQDQHYPDLKPDKDIPKKENYRPISLKNTNAKILNNILAIQQYIKKIIYHD